MKTNHFTHVHILSMLVLLVCLALSACTAAASIDLTEPKAKMQVAEDIVAYKEFTLPSPEGISFELPEDWDFWANAGYLSPDDGKTYAGIRLAWIEEGQDTEVLLYNEGSILHDKTNLMIGDLETHRYIVEVTLTNAITKEVISHTYEMIYAFPDPKGELMIGVVFSAPSKQELDLLVPIAEHMVESLKWGSSN